MRSWLDLQETTFNSSLYYNVLLQLRQAPHCKVQLWEGGRKFRSIHTICHLLFQQATSVFLEGFILEGFILASAWIKRGITPWPFLSSSPASLTHTRFPCTTAAISPAVHSTSASPLIRMYSQNHCAHRDQFIFPSPVAPFILCRKKLAASNKECYE